MKKEKKGSTTKKIILDLLIIICLAVMVVSGYKLFEAYKIYHKGTKAYEKIQEVHNSKQSNKDPVNWGKLDEMNKDVVAWIYQSGTPLNYPIVQGRDNKYYLHRMLDGNYDVKGTLFVDCRIERPFHDFNTIIYGHRMKDHSMFWTIGDYRKQDYWEKHKTMKIYTRNRTYNLKIFAAITIPSDSNLYKFHFNKKGDKQNYLNEVFNKSVIQTGITATPKDKIVMLSTCTYEFENARACAYGKLIPEKE